MNIQSIVEKGRKNRLFNFGINSAIKVMDFWGDIFVKGRFHYERSMKKDKTVLKIAFIVQMPEVWDKQSGVYEKLSKIENIELSLIVVPSYNMQEKCLGKYGYEKEFFSSKYENVLDGIDDNGIELDLKKMGFHYVFFQRPYDMYLPPKLRSSFVSKYAKTCYIPYGYQGSDVFTDGNTNRPFFRNIYFGFMDSKEIKDILCQSFKKNCEKGIQHFEYLGYPVFETYLNMKTDYCAKRVLWTPRWSYDKKLGGSHFMEYKDEFIKLTDDFENLDLKIRPHPLMFSNFVQNGLMDEDDVDEYKNKLKEKNIVLDSGNLIEDTFKETDILLTDFSSIIIMFFMTGKPIIYCPFKMKLNEEYNKLLPGLYIAQNWNEVLYYLKNLVNGNDYLKDKRKEIIEKEFSCHESASDKIVNCIIEDYKKNNR